MEYLERERSSKDAKPSPHCAHDLVGVEENRAFAMGNEKKSTWKSNVALGSDQSGAAAAQNILGNSDRSSCEASSNETIVGGCLVQLSVPEC